MAEEKNDYQLFLDRMMGSMFLLWILSTITIIIYIIIFDNSFSDNLFLDYLLFLVGFIVIASVGTLAANSAIRYNPGTGIVDVIVFLLFCILYLWYVIVKFDDDEWYSGLLLVPFGLALLLFIAWLNKED